MSNLSGKPQGNPQAGLQANLSAPGGPAESETASLMARARVMMVVSALTTALAIAAVVAVIGYRVFAAGTGVASDGVITLPKGARVLSAGASAGRLAVLVDIGGASEVLTFDIKTLKETGRLRFATEP